MLTGTLIYMISGTLTVPNIALKLLVYVALSYWCMRP
jgi:hypothetical protein